jgi:hypothetical protein
LTGIKCHHILSLNKGVFHLLPRELRQVSSLLPRDSRTVSHYPPWEKTFSTHLCIHSISRKILRKIFNILSVHSQGSLLHLPMATTQRNSTLKFTLIWIQYSLFVTIQQMGIFVMIFANSFLDCFVKQTNV